MLWPLMMALFKNYKALPMAKLEILRKAIVASGSITASDVVALRDIVYTDGRVEQKEAEFLFKLKKELTDFGNLKEWNSFFIQAICDFILDDSRSPEAIDELEARWLLDQIGEDAVIDEVEQELLARLRREAKHFPSDLSKIQRRTSIAKNLGRKIFLLLCGNTKTMRSIEYGMTRTGERKESVHHIRANTNSEDDDHEE